MNNIWITSDTHFFHKNIAGHSVSDWKSGYRDFSSIEEMNDTLTDNINKLVKENDVLYHLGDWSFGGKDKIEISRKRINCKTIFLQFGNHDHHIRKEFMGLFTDCSDTRKVKLAGRSFFFNHYCHKLWENSHHGVIHLYGHSHGSLEDDPTSLSMDVGMDICLFGHKKYTPYHIDEIIYIMDTYKSFAPKDHHNSRTT